MEISAEQIKKYKGKTQPQLLKIATKWFNQYIRQRDSDGDYFQCISCQEWKSVSQMNAGHFMSAGHHTVVRFDENNVHGQCIKCNCHLHGNLISYQDNLVKKIGQEELDRIKTICRQTGKLDNLWLIGIIETYKAKCK